MLRNFLELLFDPGQKTCFTHTAKGTRVREPKGSDTFFCINALHPTKDLRPEMNYHHANKPRRADCNVVCYRNFLVEIDSMPVEEQVQYVQQRLPFSTAVYSGGKSMHFIVSLKEPLQSEEEYRQMAERIHKAVPEADASTKNPSRLSRLPYRYRLEKRKWQNLVHIGSRVDTGMLKAELPEVEKYTAANISSGFLDVNILNAVHMPDATRADLGLERNSFFFWLGCRLNDAGLHGEERRNKVLEAYQNLKDKQSFPQREALHAARAL